MSDDSVEEGIEPEVELIDAVPWYNADTVATAMLFAANMASATAAHFQNLAMLAMGHAAHEWIENDKADFASEVSRDISTLPEGGAVDG